MRKVTFLICVIIVLSLILFSCQKDAKVTVEKPYKLYIKVLVIGKSGDSTMLDTHKVNMK